MIWLNQQLEGISKNSFRLKRWNCFYRVVVIASVATHPIWLTKCDYCLDVQFWVRFIEWLPSTNSAIDLGNLLTLTGALLVGIYIFGAETLRETNASLRSRVFLLESEVIPFLMTFAAVVLLYSPGFRLFYGLLSMTLFVHLVSKNIQLLRLLLISSETQRKELEIFCDLAVSEISTIVSKADTDLSNNVLLHEFILKANSAILDGNSAAFRAAHQYLLLYVQKIREQNNHAAISVFFREYGSLSMNAFYSSRSDIQRTVAREILVMSTEFLLVSHERGVTKNLAELCIGSLEDLLWPIDEESGVQHNRVVLDTIGLLFESHINWYLKIQASKAQFVHYTVNIQVLLNGCGVLLFSAVRRRDVVFVLRFFQIVARMRDELIDYDSLCKTTEGLAQYHSLSCQFDNLTFHVAAYAVQQSLLDGRMESEILTHCFETIAESNYVNSLQSAISVWSCDRCSQPYTQQSDRRQVKFAATKDNSSEIELLTAVILVSKLNQHHSLNLGVDYESHCTIHQLIEFRDCLQQSVKWIGEQQKVTTNYVEDAGHGITHLLLPAVKNLLEQSTKNASSHQHDAQN